MEANDDKTFMGLSRKEFQRAMQKALRQSAKDQNRILKKCKRYGDENAGFCKKS